MIEYFKDLLKLGNKDKESLDDCLENETDRERRLQGQLEKELYGLAHKEVLWEGRFLVREIIPLRLRKGNVVMYSTQANLYLDENKENLPIVENYTDWNNFFKQYLLSQSRGFLAVGEKPNIIEGDLLQIKTGLNIDHRNYVPYPEDKKLFHALQMSYMNASIWVPLLHSYDRISLRLNPFRRSK